MKTNNEIVLSVSELKAVLPGLSKVISKRSSLPVLGCVRVERNAEGEVNIQATDLDDYLTVRIKEAVPGQAGAFLVPYEPLCKAIKNSSAKATIVLVAGGKKEITLRTFIGSNAVDQKLEVVDVSEWPPLPVITGSAMMVDQGLKLALQEALSCASRDESRLILNAAYLDVADPKAHYVVGTNGRALFSANSFHFDLKESLLIPARKFLGWSGFWEPELCWLSQEPGIESGKNQKPGYVQFKTDQWTFITRQIEGNYPNWKQIIPTGSAKTILKLSQAAVEEMLNVIPQLPGKAEMNSPITLVVANNHLQIQARSKADEKPTTIPIDGTIITGKNVSVGLNREYVIKALHMGLSEILVEDSLTPVLYQAQGKRLLIASLNPGIATTTPAAPQPTATAEAPVSSPAQPQNQTHDETQIQNPNERTDMTKTTATVPTANETLAHESAIKQVIQQVEKIKDALKDVIGEFSDVLASLKIAEKEKRTTEKEIEAIRTTLKTIQSVKI